jgi:hypothetical protein
MKRFRLPNGSWVWNAPRAGAETRFIYKEVFEERCYEQHGVVVADGDVVIDVGANVGLFSLSLMERHQGLRLICIEPVSATRACLERNLQESPYRARHDVAVLGVALGARAGEAVIWFYPSLPGAGAAVPVLAATVQGAGPQDAGKTRVLLVHGAHPERGRARA